MSDKKNLNEEFDRIARARIAQDNSGMEESIEKLASATRGREFYSSGKTGEGVIIKVLEFFHRKGEIPFWVEGNPMDELEGILSRNGIFNRTVTLDEDWEKDVINPLIVKRKDNGEYAALIPKGTRYQFYDTVTEKNISVTAKNKNLFENTAQSCMKKLPDGRVSSWELVKYSFGSIERGDWISIILFALLATLVGALNPFISRFLVNTVITEGEVSLLGATMVFMISISITSILLKMLKSFVDSKIRLKAMNNVRIAATIKLYSLPASFFKEYSSGELAKRVNHISNACYLILSIVFDSAITALFSFIYVGQVSAFAPCLLVPSLIFTILGLVCTVSIGVIQVKRTRKVYADEAKENGLSYSMITGIQKIKSTGAEKRMFAKWSDIYSKVILLKYKPILLSVLNVAISAVGIIVIYNLAAANHVSAADYYAFDTAYGNVAAALSAFAGVGISLAKIQPSLEMAEPILNGISENQDGRQLRVDIEGAVEFQNVSFRYTPDQPYIIEDFSLSVRKGEYVGIVGKSGSGKSTLIRLLLGFEKPDKGIVMFDGEDMGNMDLSYLRRQLGTVMQHEKLFPGSIYSNIMINSSEQSEAAAWKAAEMAGVDKDIREMPMGMFTSVSEGSGGLSGGQKQRILIARALASDPKLLVFDEATSALDNITQKTISDGLSALKCTRICVAHRLSTVRECDRILVMDRGRIVEEGSYEELIALNGVFADLVRNQRLDLQ